MLSTFIAVNRAAILERARSFVTRRTSPRPDENELKNGLPAFIDQLTDALRLSELGETVDYNELRASAGRHGGDLLHLGLSIAQVVRDYGDVCQSITSMAIESKAAVSTDEFRTLNYCLDDAIAAAVTEYSRQREADGSHSGTERLATLAHELQTQLNSAMLAFDRISMGHVGPMGSTGVMHGRSLLAIRDLIDRSLIDVRLDSSAAYRTKIQVKSLVEEAEIVALFQSRSHGIRLDVLSVDAMVMVEGDRQILAAALAILLTNAFRYSTEGGIVSLTASTANDRVYLSVEDSCGGLSAERVQAFEHPVADGGHRNALRHGLAICSSAAERHDGLLRVRTVPRKGCVMTLDLPRKWPGPPLQDRRSLS